MKEIFIQEFSKNDWAGVLIEDNKLKACTFYKTSEQAVIDYLQSYCDSDYIIRHSPHPLLALIKKIRFGEPYELPEINFDFSGYTPKEVKVLKTVFTIPRGETMSYGDVAKEAGFQGAARFVGNVMKKNRFAPIIPCHRVIKADGTLGCYSINVYTLCNGTEIKRKLLEQEKEN